MNEVNDMGDMGDLSESDVETSLSWHPSQVKDMDPLYQDLQATILVALKPWRDSEPGCFSFVIGLNRMPTDREIGSAGCLIWSPGGEDGGTITDATVLPSMHPRQISSWLATMRCARESLLENGGDSWKNLPEAKHITF